MQMAEWLRGLGRGAVIGILLMTWPSLAQDPHRVRGAIVDVDMPTVEIETRDGQHFNVTVSDSTRLFVVTPGQQDDLNEGQFVGITSIMEQDGRHVALEVHIFADELRGLGEGHYAWDLVDQPNMMTNATIAEITMIDDRSRLMVMYGQDSDQPRGDGSLWIDIPPTIPITHLAKGDSKMLASGRRVFSYLNESDDGSTIALAIIVGDGVRPPM